MRPRALRVSDAATSVLEVADDPAIAFEHVSKSYASRSTDGSAGAAVDDLTLAVRPHEVLVLVGPSGCGKSTTLRMANRLVEPTSGRILLEGEDVTTVDPVGLRRRMGYVIQNVGLFPHRTVAQNVATVPGPGRLGPQAHGRAGRRAARPRRAAPGPVRPPVPARAVRRRAAARRRRPRAGHRPARCCSWTSRSARSTRWAGGGCRPSSRGSSATLGITVMLVTHDIDEAVRMADRVAVLSTGAHIEQLASPLDIVARPATPAVADLVGRGRTARLLALGRLRARWTWTPASQDGAARRRRRVDASAPSSATCSPRSSARDGPRAGARTSDGRVVGSATPATVVRALDRLDRARRTTRRTPQDRRRQPPSVRCARDHDDRPTRARHLRRAARARPRRPRPARRAARARHRRRTPSSGTTRPSTGARTRTS